jgi:hypothetical protein
VSLILWSIPRNQDVSKIGSSVFCIVTFEEKGLATYVDKLDTKGSDLKPYLIKFWIHSVWICTWQQIDYYHYNKLEEITRYVPIGDSHQNVEFCSNKTIAPKDSNSVGLAISKM